MNKRKPKFNFEYKPLILNLKKLRDKKIFLKLKKDRKIKLVDNYTEQLKELFAIKEPKKFFSENFEPEFNNNLNTIKNVNEEGRWVYFSWLNSAVHILEEGDFFCVRTARNKLLINEDEQLRFYNSYIGIAGLSIGSSVAMSIVLQGGAKKIKLADFDILSLSNTNRINSGIQNLGSPKIYNLAKQIYEINPYAKLEFFTQGLNKSNIKKFTKNLDLIVDEMDDLELKFRLRLAAKKYKIPLIMGADNADMAVVDIERYDINKSQKFFLGRVKQHEFKKINTFTKKQVGQLIAKIIGIENHSPRMLLSLREIGNSIISWPQLGGTAMLNGSAVCYFIRIIIAQKNKISGRFLYPLNQDSYGK